MISDSMIVDSMILSRNKSRRCRHVLLLSLMHVGVTWPKMFADMNTNTRREYSERRGGSIVREGEGEREGKGGGGGVVVDKMGQCKEEK